MLLYSVFTMTVTCLYGITFYVAVASSDMIKAYVRGQVQTSAVQHSVKKTLDEL